MMQTLALLLIMLLCAACAGGPSAQPAANVPETSPTQTPTRIRLPATWTQEPSPVPSLTPSPRPSRTPTSTLIPSPTRTPPPTPIPWQLWFYGHSCYNGEGLAVGECGPAWTLEEEGYFVVMSDGSGLQPLDVTGLPPTATPPPDFLPADRHYEISVSPDGVFTAYIQDQEMLAVLPVDGGEAVLRFVPELSVPEGRQKISSLCWKADSSVLRTLITQYDNMKRRVSFGVYSFRLDGSPPEVFFPPPGIEDTVKGVCSPDGTEVFFANWSNDAFMAGIYKINLVSLEAVPVLHGYHIAVLSGAPIKER